VSAEAVRWVFEHSPLKGTELLVHVAVADTVNEKYDWQMWASVATLAEKARCNRNTVREVLRKLEAGGMLEPLVVERGKACRYVFLMPNVAAVARPAAETRSAPEEANVAPDCADLAPQAPNVAPVARQNTTNATEPSVTQLLAADFATFWAIYPRKVKRPKALEAFTRAAKRSYPHEIIDGAERWADYWRDARTEQQYIPHPMTFLNGDQWNDGTPALPLRARRAAEADDAGASVAAALTRNPHQRERLELGA
jgi:hypothetical protein